MSQADGFYHLTINKRGGIILSLIEIDGVVDGKAIARYIQQRQNMDGGYTFCQGAESNAQDTFYAIETLDILRVRPRNVDRTIKFMRNLQHSDGGFDSVQVAYYVTAVLSRLGAEPAKPIRSFLESL